MRRRALFPVLLLGLAPLLSSVSCQIVSGNIAPSAWDHIVVVFEENKNSGEVAGLSFISQLRASGRTYERSYGVARPSQPNYIAVFAGSTLGVADNLDHDLIAPCLYSRYLDAGLSMVSYAEGLPSDGYRGSASGRYVRKHNPAASFPALPNAAITAFANFPSDYATLPELSFVIPDLDHDMHDGTPAQADAWLQANLGAYAAWAATHRSLLILTFDEPNTSSSLATPILTVFVGEGIEAGSRAGEPINQYSLSHYLTDCFGLPRL
jgi:phosphatidylinositol-3-phosphatase